VTAGLLVQDSRSPSGLRKVNSRRDMAQVADLIELVFRGDLDPFGLRMVREMRAMGRAGYLGWALNRLLLPPAARPQGFVWEADGRVVGNASLLAVNGFPERWVLANVAVGPGYRRRGIGRQMVEAAIELAMERGAGSDETFDRAVGVIGHHGVAEVIALLGYYSAVAMAMKTYRLPIPGR